jgi:ectoine hydroxylase-related dioxygenase (phytanoyl-CoA dioxygenase family)
MVLLRLFSVPASGMKRKPAVEEVAFGEMDVGDCLLMLGNCYHGAGANVTAVTF